ncbi:hypothetical protein [Caldibacillus thermoamylovorans]|uniref:hypothetical protein n=1 Tax=Caldibacillus thermoamylovorans TaxID=35841 RepID=UPI00126031A6|nr:hypothetical protein [Caldibacillus thermoamylovorans]
MATKPVLVVFFWLETHFFGDETRSRRLFYSENFFFGDETRSRRHFKPGNSFFWRRDPFSSSFFGWKLIFLATKPVLVVFFWLETHFFGDEILSRRLFLAGNSFFWRRNPFSSSFFGRKLIFLATRPVLVVFLSREIHFFGDEILSRRLFEPGNTHFWRRNPFSSSFFGWKLIFLATKPVLVVFLSREIHFFGDETRSRRLFLAGNSFFWRRDPFSSSF